MCHCGIYRTCDFYGCKMLSWVSPSKYIEVLTPAPQNMTTLGNRAHGRYNPFRQGLHRSQVAPHAMAECPETEVSVWKHRNPRLRDAGGRHWARQLQQGMPEAGKLARIRRSHPGISCRTVVWCLASKTVRQEPNPAVSSHPVCGAL